jgi:predicted metal-binding membrane protein
MSLKQPRAIEVGVGALLVALAGLSWALTGERMAGMDAGPGTDLGGIGWFIGVWVAMMAAMMLPSFAPIAIGHTRIGSATTLFVAGYVITWGAAGLIAYAVIEGLRSLDPSVLAWGSAGPYFAGAVILAAAIYQLTSLKNRCLHECRNPVMLVEHQRPGRFGALQMGIEHGRFCIGCCWALMAALFALGVMSLVWMAFTAVVIAAEKLLPWSPGASRAIALVLAVLAIAVAFVPARVPGLTIPGSSDAPAMQEMGMAEEAN